MNIRDLIDEKDNQIIELKRKMIVMNYAIRCAIVEAESFGTISKAVIQMLKDAQDEED